MQKKFTVRDLALIGVLAALVFAASWISINIPTSIDNTRLHLGNVMCLLSGLLLGPLPGGLAAGIGSMFFDFTNPLYTKDAVFTLVFKFLMAWLCGRIAHARGVKAENWRRNIVAAVCGALLYVVLYLSKNFIINYYFSRLELETVLLTLSTKAITSTVNAVIAVAAAAPLATAIRKALKSDFFNRGNGERKNNNI